MLSLPVDSRWESLRRRFSADSYVALPGLIGPAGLAALVGEARRLESDAVRRTSACRARRTALGT